MTSWNQRGNELIYNPPFVVEVNIDAKFNDFIPMFTGYAMDCVDSLASKNDARRLFKQLLEADNNTFAALVQDLADAVQFYVDCDNLNYNQVEVVIRNTVLTVVDAYLALAVDAFQQEFGPLLDQEMLRDIPNYIQALEAIKYDARRFYSGGTSGWGRGGRTEQRGWQPNQQRGRASTGGGRSWNTSGSRWDEPEQPQQQGGYRSSNDGWPGNRQNGPNRAASQRGGRTIWDDSPNTSRGQVSNSPNDSNVRPRRQFETQKPAAREQRRVQPIDRRQETVDGQVFVPASDTRDYPKVADLQRLFDWILMDDGTQLRPAALSTWKVSYNPQMPATPWYNPQTHILFHFKHADGTVEERILKREEGMKYLDHELNPRLRQKAQDAAMAAGDAPAPAWRLVEQLRPNPSSPLATADPLGEGVEGLDVARPKVPQEYLSSPSLSDAFKRINLRLKMDNPNVLRTAYELYVDRAVLTTVANPDFDQVEDLARSESFKLLFDKLMDQSIDAELADEIDRRVTDSITEALQMNMGLKGWSISNFREDIGDLLAMLREDYGDVVVEALETYAIEIISRNLTYYGADEMTEARKIVNLPEEQDALIWRERCSITRIPMSSEELRLPNDNGTLVMESATPELFQTLSSIFDRTQDIPQSFHGRYLVTTDGIVYAIVRGYFNDQSILLFKADFTLQ